MLNGDIKALAKLITYVEENPDDRFCDNLPSKNAKIIGFTGSPGAGKSTIVSGITSNLRNKGKKIGVIAVDPSSPFTGGAFLGDRIRMKRHFLDSDVFIRSMASRGNIGGLNESIFDVIKIMDSFGFDYILIETVGAGQSEIEIVYAADIVVLVLSPGSGDEIQLMKAGIMEIADIYVINKADQDGANVLKTQLEALLSFSNSQKPIYTTVATTGIGIEDVTSSIIELLKNFEKSGELQKRTLRRNKKHVETIILRKVRETIESQKYDFTNTSSIIKNVIEKLCKEFES
ncbi:methylmalonyl Co-A mutase-associated GTPase MeaB [Thermosipho ferrireducens]|uniref:Methylmalonyl Co-A mutase-associated GTPase MeaB n=2 Tax=Thermosipho ferrireducens TaxID=2571116 RepID=A0ABX7SBQ8_9BACT|nr:methylmalonyl Co-A mutase-associated GTPase MeaB [Thermosipho ferrireducens]